MEIINVLKDLAIVVGVPVLRSGAGWAEKALADYRVTAFEWRQLGQTVVHVGTMALMAYLGLDAMGIDNAAIAGSVSAFFLHKVLTRKKK